jgi:hypothetical protein
MMSNDVKQPTAQPTASAMMSNDVKQPTAQPTASAMMSNDVKQPNKVKAIHQHAC